MKRQTPRPSFFLKTKHFFCCSISQMGFSVKQSLPLNIPKLKLPLRYQHSMGKAINPSTGPANSKSKKHILSSNICLPTQQCANITQSTVSGYHCTSDCYAEVAASDEPKMRKKRSGYSERRHISNERTAAQIASLMNENRKDPLAPVIHVEAVNGLLCEELLKQGVPTVIALNSTKKFTENSMDLQTKFGADRFFSFSWPMLSLYLKLSGGKIGQQSSASYSLAEAQVSQLLQEKTPHGSSYAIFHVGTKSRNEHFEFLFYILRNIANDDPIISQPGVEFFFLAHPRFKDKLEYLSNITESSRSVRISHMLTHIYLLYDISFIGQLAADDFNPPCSKVKRVHDPDWLDPTVRYLVKFSLKENIDSILPLEEHLGFLFFLRQLHMKRWNRIIPSMEMLVPGCGLRMIALDFTMMDLIQHTKPERMLHLYKHLVTWPEFLLSPLKNHIIQRTRGGTIQWAEEDAKDEENL